MEGQVAMADAWVSLVSTGVSREFTDVLLECAVARRGAGSQIQFMRLPKRVWVTVILTVFLMILYHFIICQFSALLPLVTGQAWLRSDVLEPQPGFNYWRKLYVPGSGCSGQVSSGPLIFPP